MIKRIGKFFKKEEGQSLVEFALVLAFVLLPLITLPIDYFRIAYTKMLLNEAVSDCISQVVYNTSSSEKIQVEDYYEANYKDIIENDGPGREVHIEVDVDASEATSTYDYYVYSSDKENAANYTDKFDNKPGSYTTKNLKVQMTYDIKPWTLFGKVFLGDEVEVKSTEYKRTLYCRGNN